MSLRNGSQVEPTEPLRHSRKHPPLPRITEFWMQNDKSAKMEPIVFDDCPRHGNGDPKRPAQVKRRQENCCVYCETRKSEHGMLGLACNAKECQQKRWSESKLTARQDCVMQGVLDGMKDLQVAEKLRIFADRETMSVESVKQHKRAIAKKFDVPCDRVLLARCYMEWKTFINAS
jgi:hypothetical protein